MSRKRRIISQQDAEHLLSFVAYIDSHRGQSLPQRLDSSKVVARASGFSLRSVQKLRALSDEELADLPVSRVTETRKRERAVPYDVQLRLCELVYDIYRRRKRPSLNMLLQESASFFTFSKTTLRNILLDHGFRFGAAASPYANTQNAEFVRDQRIACLVKIKKAREVGSTIFYQDETWLNKNMRQPGAWHDRDGPLDRDMAPKTGQGPRWIVSQIASSATGIVPEVGLIFKADSKSGDYHGCMDFDNFSKWLFEKAFPYMAQFPNPVFVMDRASYHMKLTPESTPASSHLKKAAIIDWLVDHDIEYDASMKRMDLLTLVRENKPKPELMIVKEANRLGIDVIILPTATPILNPIEFCWCVLKSHVRKENTEYKMDLIQKSFEEAMEKITPEAFAKFEKRAIAAEDRFIELFNDDDNDIFTSGNAENDVLSDHDEDLE